MLFWLLAVLLSSCPTVTSGSLRRGQACNQSNNRLQIGTYQFWSECDSVTFCSEQGICENKRCRSDDFPFGYPQGSGDIPAKCPKGQFCPDEGSDCQTVLPVGSSCQLNRDDQCEGPPNFHELADTSGRGLNSNGSVCLNNVCMLANVTAGSPCVVENTPYIVYGTNGESIDIVSRGNCKIGHYCDSQSRTCIKSKLLDEACSADKECNSMNCLSDGRCGIAAATPRHFNAWIYILVGLSILGGMSGVLVGLYMTHQRQSRIERAKRAQYWCEQNELHRKLLKTREAAHMTLSSPPHKSEDHWIHGDRKNRPPQRYTDKGDTPVAYSSSPLRSTPRINPGRF